MPREWLVEVVGWVAEELQERLNALEREGWTIHQVVDLHGVTPGGLTLIAWQSTRGLGAAGEEG